LPLKAKSHGLVASLFLALLTDKLAHCRPFGRSAPGIVVAKVNLPQPPGDASLRRARALRDR